MAGKTANQLAADLLGEPLEGQRWAHQSLSLI